MNIKPPTVKGKLSINPCFEQSRPVYRGSRFGAAGLILAAFTLVWVLFHSNCNYLVNFNENSIVETDGKGKRR